MHAGARAAAFEYLKTHPTVDPAEFEAYCGVGVKVPREDIARIVAELIQAHHESIVTERYRYPVGPLLAKVGAGAGARADRRTASSRAHAHAAVGPAMRSRRPASDSSGPTARSSRTRSTRKSPRCWARGYPPTTSPSRRAPQRWRFRRRACAG